MSIRLMAMAVALCTALGACSPQGGTKIEKTITATPAHLSEWRQIRPATVIVNIADFADTVWYAKQRIGHGGVIQQKIYFDSGGYMHVQHITAPEQFFSIQKTAQVNELSTTLEETRRLFKSYNRRPPIFGEKRRIYKKSDRGGWLVSASNGRDTVVCLISHIGFQDDAEKARASSERYDTIVEFQHCSHRPSISAVEAFLRGLKLVP